ncbi:hypothetical protein CEJ86_32955 [Sinorhizobium meliloti]|uniref:Uncharacterized protein n=1 Tax=Rhizobium meliloti TaxID=382 RepID=A0A2J0YST3_RHIML|nr:hypothetical protein CEJ86_32955 [Sinorhizobium meliloti]
MNLDEWAHFFRLLRYLGPGQAVVEIAGTRPGQPYDEFTLRTPLDPQLVEYAMYLESVVSMAAWLCKESGVLDPVLSKAQIEESADEIEMAYNQMTTQPDDKIVFRSIAAEGSVPSPLVMRAGQFVFRNWMALKRDFRDLPIASLPKPARTEQCLLVK